MSSESVANGRVSSLLRSALDINQDGFVTVGEVMDRVEERGFGLLLILLALPMLIPMPPGTSGPVGILYALLGLQMTVGRAHPWLPHRVRVYKLSPRVLGTLQNRGVAFMERMERLSRPRWGFMENPISLRIIGLLVIFIGIVMFLPLPFMNSLPAIGIVLIGIGLLNRDGILLLAGAVFCLGIVVFLMLGTHLIFRAWDSIRKMF
jgi:hypothetical protein